MKNIKNNLILSSFILLALLAFGLKPSSASAYYYVGWINGNYIGCETDLGVNGEFLGCGHHTDISYTPNTYNTNNTLFGNSNQTSKYNTTTSTTIKQKDTTTTKSVKDVKAINNTDKNNGLSANAIFGSSGFVPVNIFQWFLVLIMILMIVILTRKIVAKERPLKHA